MLAATVPHPTIAGVNTLRLLPAGGTPTLSSAVTGIKWNPRGTTMVLSGEIVWRMGNGGLTAPFTPMLTLDYLF